MNSKQGQVILNHHRVICVRRGGGVIVDARKSRGDGNIEKDVREGEKVERETARGFNGTRIAAIFYPRSCNPCNIFFVSQRRRKLKKARLACFIIEGGGSPISHCRVTLREIGNIQFFVFPLLS